MIHCIELFAGAGGTALGFERAGIKHVLMNELCGNAVKTLRANFKDSNIVHGDVKKLDLKNYKDIDILQAGFPCQAFSYAGKGLGFADDRGALFFDVIRCINETKPKIFIGENVRGLVNHNKGETLKYIIKLLSEAGYNTHYKVLRAQHLDVPQKRERLIIYGIRKDLNIKPVFPEEKPYIITLEEALHNCPISIGQKYSDKKMKIFAMIPEGGNWKDLPLDLQKSYMGASFYHSGGKTGIARRLSRKQPCLTLTCNPSQNRTERCHPTETRPLTIREYARIQTFPDSWQFYGSLSSQYKQIGNAVPVNLAYQIGVSALTMLLGENVNLE